jgi:hypothetical protein
MIIFIDESGDPGFKIQKGSSKFFIVGLVIFDDDLDAEELAVKIKRLKKDLKKSNKFEFKFNKCSRDYRLKFFETVKNGIFRIRAIVVDKTKIYSPTLQTSKDKFYNYIIKSLLKNNGDTISNAKIRLDGLGERIFKKNMVSYLRQNLNNKHNKVIKDFKFRDSQKDVLIQLADMIVGAIGRYYAKNKKDHQDYYSIIKNRIEDIWDFK